jgi:hypothetical protein
VSRFLDYYGLMSLVPPISEKAPSRYHPKNPNRSLARAHKDVMKKPYFAVKDLQKGPKNHHPSLFSDSCSRQLVDEAYLTVLYSEVFL